VTDTELKVEIELQKFTHRKYTVIVISPMISRYPEPCSNYVSRR
jgi:hypothetical protein